jgi:CubicO group peptidase (beta-lactamase class C family)
MIRVLVSLRAAALSVLFAVVACIYGVSQESNYDGIVQDVLNKTGVPSASVAIVRDGKLSYLHAFGFANLEAKAPAQSSMRYSIGSISKQFTAAAILLLQEKGKLSLDDKVGKYVPDVTDANEVTIRELLSQTSGYQDYWPQDYVMPEMLKPTTAQHILDKWARIPLDFKPGTRWQYSNTNYVISGLIVEKVSGTPFIKFLQENIFAPLHMTSVLNIDQEKLTTSDATGYMRYALGSLHPAPKEGQGWLFAMGELAMTAEDLTKWDISLINQSLLKPQSYREMEQEVTLTSGPGTHYGLGVDVGMQGEHRFVAHGGEVSGFTAQNTVFPDDKLAVVVLTNQDAIGAASQIAERIGNALLMPQLTSSRETELAKQIFAGLQQGKIDRSLFTSNCNAYFDDTALHDYAASLQPLGKVQKFELLRESLRGGMVHRNYRVKLDVRWVNINSFWMPDGKIEQFIVTPRDSQ